ncbi:sensor histidine kinase [Nonlabens tegetincola]|uniref:sensor histidine kinase n=1 Tax=Nonlabens tegetincola TaxID=323273 RepID=UPI000695F858|nr:ATP-binding protein [Nonlabens tegetincola]
MQIQNHILEVLQLYEYAMAIGKSLDFKNNCESFIKLLLKRQNLNAAWVLKGKENYFETVYSLPKGTSLRVKGSELPLSIIDNEYILLDVEKREILNQLSPITLKQGHVAVYNLKTIGFLFLYTKKNNLNQKELAQLKPVIDKFTTSLRASTAFEEQQNLLNNLEARNQELSDYAHMVSHDLKSPLRSIDTLSSWLQEDYKNSLDATGQQHLDTVRENVLKMDNLIDGILQYSSIDKHNSDFYDVHPNKIISEIINSIVVPENIKLVVNELPVIKGDTYRVRQLFQNLITNAITYNNKEHGYIEIGYNNSEKGIFYIKDNGIGIDKKYHQKIFKTFEKLENKKGSSGIGLSIVNKIIEYYNGQIWIESEPGIGTTFYFTLP